MRFLVLILSLLAFSCSRSSVPSTSQEVSVQGAAGILSTEDSMNLFSSLTGLDIFRWVGQEMETPEGLCLEEWTPSARVMPENTTIHSCMDPEDEGLMSTALILHEGIAISVNILLEFSSENELYNVTTLILTTFGDLCVPIMTSENESSTENLFRCGDSYWMDLFSISGTYPDGRRAHQLMWGVLTNPDLVSMLNLQIQELNPPTIEM